jgi:hypothetical protein
LCPLVAQGLPFRSLRRSVHSAVLMINCFTQLVSDVHHLVAVTVVTGILGGPPGDLSLSLPDGLRLIEQAVPLKATGFSHGVKGKYGEGFYR